MRDAVRQAGKDPAGLEELYRRARRHGEAEEFDAAIRACAAEAPENLLYRAWSLRSGSGDDWLPRFREALGRALALPVVWALWVVVVVPLL